MMASTDKIMTPKQIAAVVKKVERHKAALAKHRDALRDMLSDIEEITEDADDVVTNLDCALDRLSRYL